MTLFKDNVYEDFGFSVSDGLYEKGIFVNRVRAGGPADGSGLLRPLDRILQINSTRTADFDCCLAVPLIAAADDRIELIVSRATKVFELQGRSRDSLERAFRAHNYRRLSNQSNKSSEGEISTEKVGTVSTREGRGSPSSVLSNFSSASIHSAQMMQLPKYKMISPMTPAALPKISKDDGNNKQLSRSKSSLGGLVCISGNPSSSYSSECNQKSIGYGSDIYQTDEVDYSKTAKKEDAVS